MIEAVSCGGVVFYRGKVLLLYKNQKGKNLGWVLPKGTLENGETFKQAALREVREETSSSAQVLKFIGKTKYIFKGYDDTVNKTVYWYLMSANSFYCKPQTEEYFSDAGFYKQHEAYHLLKFNDEKQILQKAFIQYNDLRKQINKQEGI
ncbi:MAG: NUDIX domain-containing protein [Clostridiales bacterium]|nr:NUDIX domain-containing protein [Clostridiales bacterium]